MKGCLVAIGLLALMGMCGQYFCDEDSPPSPQAQEQQPPSPEEQEEANRKAREAAVRNQQALGTLTCTQAIESIPEFAFRWTNSWTESKWNKVSVVGDKLVFGGDRLEVQNQFGAWVRRSYACEFDVSTEVADAVLLPKGALAF